MLIPGYYWVKRYGADSCPTSWEIARYEVAYQIYRWTYLEGTWSRTAPEVIGPRIIQPT